MSFAVQHSQTNPVPTAHFSQTNPVPTAQHSQTNPVPTAQRSQTNPVPTATVAATPDNITTGTNSLATNVLGSLAGGFNATA